MLPTETNKKADVDILNCIKIKKIACQMTTSQMKKTNNRMGKTYFQIIYLIQDLMPGYIKSNYNSITKDKSIKNRQMTSMDDSKKNDINN